MTTFFCLRLLFLSLFLGMSTLALAQKPQPRNYVVLLDLSDRLLLPDQARRDQELILDVFARFEHAVRQNLIVNSTDRFRVVLAPQAGTRYNPDQVMADLYLDMQGDLTQKRQRLDRFNSQLPTRLRELYAQAMQGRTTTADFRGCDIWQYFNEHLPSDLSPTHQNVLVVLTDGYFDFEQNTHVKQQGGRYTDSHRLLAQLRRTPDWQQLLQRPDVGLLPVPKRFAPLRVWVAELSPKVDHLDELDLLRAVWTRWLRDMRITSAACLERGSLPKVQAHLRQLP